jgi:hypothetical protein
MVASLSNLQLSWWLILAAAAAAAPATTAATATYNFAGDSLWSIFTGESLLELAREADLDATLEVGLHGTVGSIE